MGRNGTTRGKTWWRRALAAVAALILLGLVVPAGLVNLSPVPAVLTMRALMEPAQLGLGPYGDAATVRPHPRIQVGVAGAPEAGLDLYAPPPIPQPPGARRPPIVLWVHGGGWISGAPTDVAPFAKVLAARGRAVVALLNYSLAPEQRYPVPVRQGHAALAWLRAHAAEVGGDATRVYVGGDSAGAQIAAQLASVESNPQVAGRLGVSPALAPGTLRGAILFCGVYDLTTAPQTRYPGLGHLLWAYTGERDWSTAAGLGDLSVARTLTPAYPPTYLTVGDDDKLAPQTAEFAAALQRSGVPVTSRFWRDQGLGHEYQFAFDTPAAQAVVTDVLAFLGRRS